MALQLLRGHVLTDRLSLNDVKRRLKLKQTQEVSVKYFNVYTITRKNVPCSNFRCSETEERISLPFRIIFMLRYIRISYVDVISDVIAWQIIFIARRYMHGMQSTILL